MRAHLRCAIHLRRYLDVVNAKDRLILTQQIIPALCAVPLLLLIKIAAKPSYRYEACNDSPRTGIAPDYLLHHLSFDFSSSDVFSEAELGHSLIRDLIEHSYLTSMFGNSVAS